VAIETRWSTFFFPGQRAEIEVSPEERYVSQIEEVTEDTLALAMPLKSGVLVRLRVGTPILLQAPKRNNWYFFKTKVVGNRLEPEPVVLLERPPDNSGEQLREYARMDLVIDNVQVWVEQDGKLGPTIRAIIVDLSAGGAQLQLRENIDPGSKITVRFKLPRVRQPRDQTRARGRRRFGFGAAPLGGRGFSASARPSPYTHGARRNSNDEAQNASDELTLDGEVVRNIVAETESGRKYRLGVRWEHLSPADRERLIRYTLQWEMEMRRRGVL
jgi:c-di-GMP-binding flagellar brake protein YcgR